MNEEITREILTPTDQRGGRARRSIGKNPWNIPDYDLSADSKNPKDSLDYLAYANA